MGWGRRASGSLGCCLTKSHPEENPGIATQIVKTTFNTTLHIKPLDVQSIVNIKNIIRSQQRIIHLDKEFSRRPTLSNSLNLFLEWNPVLILKNVTHHKN